MRVIITIAVYLIVVSANAQFKTSVKRIYSIDVKDSFDIYISTPADHFSGQYDEVIYYLDANLNSGKQLRQCVENDLRIHKKAVLYVGIGHIGNYHQLRRRDFILPFIRNGDTIPKSADYGQVDLFYQFLRSELIPSIEEEYPSTGSRTILGHSLGGLFVVYCLFSDDGLFNSYFALSPALWIDKYSIFSFNKIGDSLTKGSYFFLAAGSKEKFNQILTGFYRMKDLIEEQKYPGLRFDWQIYHGTHNSYIKKDMQRIVFDKVHR